MNIDVRVSGAQEAALILAEAERRALDLTPVMDALGVHMVSYSVPTNFKEKGRPVKWPQAWRWGAPTGSPLVDTARMRGSVGYVASATDLVIGAGRDSNLKYARLHQYGSEGLPGGVIKPVNSKFLVMPQVGPGRLTKDQARSMKPRDFKDAFILMEGPEGPGIYVNPKWGQRRSMEPVRIFAFLTKAKVPPRPFLLFQLYDIAYFGAMYVAYVMGAPNWRSARPAFGAAP